MVTSAPDFIETGAVGNYTVHLRSLFERALVAEMNFAGIAYSLPALDWRIATSPDGPVVSGMLEGSAAFRDCLAWAVVLEMKEYATLREDGAREWSASRGPWRIELLGVDSSAD